MNNYLVKTGKRKCILCKIIFELNENNFFRNKSSTGGFNYHCKKCFKIVLKQYYLANINKMRKYNKEYDQKKIRIISRQKYKEKYKKLVLEHYGNKCMCCKETNQWFLTIDHLNNDGKNFRGENNKYRLTGTYLYRYLINSNYPTNVQILCLIVI